MENPNVYMVSSIRPKNAIEIILSEFAILTNTDQETFEIQVIKMLQDLKKLCFQNNLNLAQMLKKLEESECQNEAKNQGTI